MKINIKKRGLPVVLFSVGLLCLTGCSGDVRMSNDMKNVEERDYATILLIAKGKEQEGCHFVLGMAQEKVTGEKSMEEKVSEWDEDDLEALAEAYGDVMGKDLSLAHLKIILLEGSGEEKELLKEELADWAWQEKVLTMLGGEDEIAKTCPMLKIADGGEFVEYLEDAEEPVGNYLANLVRMQERKGEEIPWLKDYLRALRENEKLQAMYLQREGGEWRIVPDLAAG